MTKKEKGRKWDGRSRPSTDLYKQNFDRIFKNGTTQETDRTTDEVCLRTRDERRQEKQRLSVLLMLALQKTQQDNTQVNYKIQNCIR